MNQNQGIPVNEPLLNGNEKQYVIDCIESGWISSEGPYVKRLELQVASWVGREHGVAVCNGTAALELAVAALELEPGSEIIVPSFTIISCVAAILRNGCVPVLVDSDPVTWNMNPDEIESKINAKTKAIMVVHIYGLPVDMDAVIKLAEMYGLKIIEDASEAIGLTYKGRLCGSFGDISTFSFYANKHITTGEGGMILTNQAHLAESCRLLRNLCFLPGKRFVHEELGYNNRMTNLQAAVGLAQWERIDHTILLKRSMGTHYTQLLSDVEGLQLPLAATQDAVNCYWVYGIVLNEDVAITAEDMMQKLARHWIGTRPFFWPMHEQPVLRKMGYFAGESYPVAERLARKGFYIPSGTAVTEQQRIAVAETVKSVMKEIWRR